MLLSNLPLAAFADDLTCQSQGGCDNAQTCTQVDETFAYRDQPGGTVTFGWTEGPKFTAQPQHHGGLTILSATEGTDIVHTLVLGADLTGTFSTAAMIDGKLFAAMETLVCRKAEP